MAWQAERRRYRALPRQAPAGKGSEVRGEVT
jgi:hypothetical protein